MRFERPVCEFVSTEVGLAAYDVFLAVFYHCQVSTENLSFGWGELDRNGWQTFYIEASCPGTDPDAKSETIILCHGFGWGTIAFAFMVSSLLAQSVTHERRIICVDWVGFGGSSHPPFEKDTPADETLKMVTGALADFVTSHVLNAVGYEPGTLTLMGHSIGGYFVAELSKHVDWINKLVLLSPCGFEKVPIHLQEDHPELESSLEAYNAEIKRKVRT